VLIDRGQEKHETDPLYKKNNGHMYKRAATKHKAKTNHIRAETDGGRIKNEIKPIC
jgi:hypothetical protein